MGLTAEGLRGAPYANYGIDRFPARPAIAHDADFPGWPTRGVIVGKHVTLDLGRALRRAREERGLSLREVSQRSRGSFTPSGIAGYERGERRISVERMCALSDVLGMPPERLLADALHSPGAELQIDVENLSPAMRDLITTYIDEVLRMNGATDPDRISVRSRDLEIISDTEARSIDEIHRQIRDALVKSTIRAKP